MGQGQSKGELLYQQVSYGNCEGIKALHREGAGLEWMDKEGKTALIVACMNPELYNVAKTLIQLGANVNAYRPGRHAGTPLHHAAKRGLESMVKLLLLHGANPLILNDDCQTALEVARAKGHSNVVRALESHLCLFSGWLREFHGPGFLEVVAPQLVSRKVWAVVLPVGSNARPFKLELAIYSTLQMHIHVQLLLCGRPI
ncbi:putative E3 ubiquitin-protein ligase XBAT35 [Gastrolobium bilobum]|uniref:putative E3 ubiquitin-protein ligase XBAT35 n=1 Tax=Gastrolobium bilobum TaxID=150636 RepID=UPI002AB27B89|nr:putative E3 ubiquitin-protein ligase XBAT35 [Gastrolobium bilobum]